LRGVCVSGFAIAAISKAGVPLSLVVILSSVLFGLAHAYQGRGGMISTGIFGVLLAIARLGFGSLVPVMMCAACAAYASDRLAKITV